MSDRHNHTEAGSDRASDERDPASDEWIPCAQGELQRMVGRNRSARRNRSIAQVASLGAVCMALWGGWLLTSQRGENAAMGHDYAGIACGDVYTQLGPFAKGTLDPATSEQIRQHLLVCPECGPIYEQMTGKPIAFNTHRCTDPTCRHCGPLQHLPVRLAGEPGRTRVTLAMK
jgi:hypothetical protein